MDARHEIELLLSAYRDGELSGAELERVEAALEADESLRTRLLDQEALSAFLRDALEQRVEEVDFAGFADGVMAGLEKKAPRKAPLWSRFRVGLAELFEYRRWQLVSSLAVAVLLLIAAPLLWEQTRPPEVGPLLAGGPGLSRVLTVATASDTDAMIFQTGSGTTVIYVQESP